MTSGQGLSERRRHRRYKVPQGAFAVLVLERDFAKLGQITDIRRFTDGEVEPVTIDRS